MRQSSIRDQNNMSSKIDIRGTLTRHINCYGPREYLREKFNTRDIGVICYLIENTFLSVQSPDLERSWKMRRRTIRSYQEIPTRS